MSWLRRRVNVVRWLESVGADLRYASRALRKAPGFVILAIGSIGLGIGVNVTVFAALDVLFFHPITVPNVGELVVVHSTIPAKGYQDRATSIPDVLDWRTQVRSMDLAAYQGVRYYWSAPEAPERVRGVRATGGILRILGLHPIVGRDLEPADETSGDRVVLLGERLWRRRFGADPTVVGRVMVLEDEPYTIVGVVQGGFRLPLYTDVWTVLTRPSTPLDRASNDVGVLGRLRNGVSRDAADAEIREVARRLAEQYPGTNQGRSARVAIWADEQAGPRQRMGEMVLIVSIAFVLLIACANVANLLLARGTARAHELATRASIGAGRGRLIRQLLTESALLAVAGGAVGIVLSVLGTTWFQRLFFEYDPMLEVGMSGRVLGFALVVTGVAGLVFGVVPAFRTSGQDLGRWLSDRGQSGIGRRSDGGLRNAFVVVQVGLAVVLVLGAGLTIQGTLRIRQVDLGFEPEAATTFNAEMFGSAAVDSVRVRSIQANLVEEVRRLPGVDVVGAASELPVEPGEGGPYEVVGNPAPIEPGARYKRIDEGYLASLGIPLVRGRSIEPGDRAGTAPVVLINAAAARRHWPGRDPLGRQIRLRNRSWEIVGVVRDVREFGPGEDIPDVLYFPLTQYPASKVAIVIRGRAAVRSLAPEINRITRSVAPLALISRLQPMTDLLDRGYQDYRSMSRLLGLFGGIALLLAMLGVYGVVSYSVTQRTAEIGVRRALGARGIEVARLVLRGTGVIVAIGGALGVGIGLLVSRALAAMLPFVAPFDLVIFVAVPLGLVLVAVAAMVGPARRATQVDPLVALRHL